MREWTLFAAVAAVLVAGPSSAAVAGEASPGFSFTRQRKIQPAFASDGKGMVLLSWQNLLLSGSDVFYGQAMVRSTDGGKTYPRITARRLDYCSTGLKYALLLCVFNHCKGYSVLN